MTSSSGSAQPVFQNPPVAHHRQTVHAVYSSSSSRNSTIQVRTLTLEVGALNTPRIILLHARTSQFCISENSVAGVSSKQTLPSMDPPPAQPSTAPASNVNSVVDVSSKQTLPSMDPPPAQSTTAPALNEKPKRSPEEIAKSVLDERHVRVFRPCATKFNPREVQLSDDFFEPSSEELADAVRQYATASQRLQNAPLMTKRMRAAETEKKMSRFRKVLIRILLPDRVALQGIFTPQSTIRQVIRFVRASLLDARNVKFHLFVVPPKMKLLDLDKTLWGEGLCPAALVHIGIDEGPSTSAELLKPWLLDQIEDPPEAATVHNPAPSIAPEPQKEEKAPAKAKNPLRKLPKWFKK